MLLPTDLLVGILGTLPLIPVTKETIHLIVHTKSLFMFSSSFLYKTKNKQQPLAGFQQIGECIQHIQKKVSKAIPKTGHGGLQGCEGLLQWTV
jgi:hypothetical protein